MALRQSKTGARPGENLQFACGCAAAGCKLLFARPGNATLGADRPIL
jgi:hypothetical protein